MPWRFRQPTPALEAAEAPEAAEAFEATDADSSALGDASEENEEIVHVAPKFLGWLPGTEEDSATTPSLRGTFADSFNFSTQSTWRSKFNSESEASMRSTGLLPSIMPAGVQVSNEPRAIWSDAAQLELDSRDCFDMKKWRSELDAELKAARRSPRFSPDCRSQSSWYPRRRPARAIKSSQVSPLPYVPPPTRDRAAILQMNSNSHDPGVDSLILRDDVRLMVANQELTEAQYAQRRKHHYREAGQEHRRRAIEWRKAKTHGHSSGRKEVKKAPDFRDTVIIDDDDETCAKTNRIQKVMARIRCLEDKSVSIVQPTGPLAYSSEKTESDPAEPPPQTFKDRIKFAVTCRLQQRRRQARKLAALKDVRAARARALPSQQKQVMEFSFAPYCRSSGNQRLIAVSDLHNCLLEAGLGGMLCSEKWSVDRVCKEMVFALALEYGSFEKMPPISNFRGSLKKTPDGEAKGNAFFEVVKAATVPVDPRSTDSFGEDPKHKSDHDMNMDGLRNLQEEVKFADLNEEAETEKETVRKTRDRSHAGRGSGAVFAIRSARKFMMSRPVSYEDFCTEIVPAVRAELTEVRQDMHFAEFLKVLEGKNVVNLTHEQFRRLTQRVGVDADLVQQVMESKGMTQASEADAGSPHPDSAISSESPDTDLDFESVHELLMSLEEQCEHRRRRRERETKEKYKLSDEVFLEHRMELNRLHDYFELYDVDHNGHLTHKEVCWLLKHVGFQPYKLHESRILARLLSEADKNNDESIDFVEFLELMSKVRERQRNQREGRVRPVFFKYAKEDGHIEVDEVNKVLDEVGIAGKTRHEQDLVQKIILEFDADPNTEVSFSDMLTLCQRVQEHILTHETDSTVRFASSLNIDRSRLAEYLWAFDQFDRDGSAGLGMSEIMEVLRMLMVRPPTNQEVQDLFAEIRVKPTEEVSLHQYLRLMQVASTGRGMFSKELPYTLRGVPMEKLRDILRIFSLADGYVRDLDDSELPELVASYLGVQPDSNLREELGQPVGNARQLLEYAHKVHLQNQHTIQPIGGSILFSRSSAVGSLSAKS